MDMRTWAKHTQGTPWGTGVRSGYRNWIRSLESTHGNATIGGHHATLYGLYEQSGRFLKWGVSQDLSSRYPGAFLEGKVIRPVRAGPRSQMLLLERLLEETQPGPWNRTPWAGKNTGR